MSTASCVKVFTDAAAMPPCYHYSAICASIIANGQDYNKPITAYQIAPNCNTRAASAVARLWANSCFWVRCNCIALGLEHTKLYVLFKYDRLCDAIFLFG